MRRGYDQSGASAVEFALILPLLVLFLFGIIQFGLAFSRAQGMEAAAREGARVASLGPRTDAAEVIGVAEGASPLFIDRSHIEVLINDEAAVGASDWCEDGQNVRVTVQITEGERGRYAIAIPFVNLGDPPAFRSTGVFRCEPQFRMPDDEEEE